MISRARGFALAAVVAAAFAFQAHAGGFNFGSFMLGNGGKSWVPECEAEEKLTEVKDKAGRSKWVCLAKQTADAQAKASDDNTRIADAKPQNAAVEKRLAEQVTDNLPQFSDGAVQLAMGMTQHAFHATHVAGGTEQAVDSKPLSADSKVQTMISGELERPAPQEHPPLSDQRSVHMEDFGF